VVAGKRKASSATQSARSPSLLKRCLPLRGTLHLPRRLPCRSPTLRRRWVGIDLGKDSPYPKSWLFARWGRVTLFARSLPFPMAEAARDRGKPSRVPTGNQAWMGGNTIFPDRYPPAAVSGPVGRQGRSGINSESSSGFRPHRTLRLPGRNRPKALPHSPPTPACRSAGASGLTNRRQREADHLTPGVRTRHAGGTFFPHPVGAPPGRFLVLARRRNPSGTTSAGHFRRRDSQRLFG
jgi:hypothetical protein